MIALWLLTVCLGDLSMFCKWRAEQTKTNEWNLSRFAAATFSCVCIQDCVSGCWHLPPGWSFKCGGCWGRKTPLWTVSDVLMWLILSDRSVWWHSLHTPTCSHTQVSLQQVKPQREGFFSDIPNRKNTEAFWSTRLGMSASKLQRKAFDVRSQQEKVPGKRLENYCTWCYLLTLFSLISFTLRKQYRRCSVN